MPNHCCVPVCTNRSSSARCKELSFHRFPKTEPIRTQWIQNIRRDPGPDFKITTSTTVCSAHFVESDFKSETKQKRRLCRTAVPTVFSWKPYKEPRRKLAARQQPIQPLNLTPPASPVCTTNQTTTTGTSPISNGSSPSTSLISLESTESPSKETLQKRNLTLLEIRCTEKFSLTRFSSSDSSIKYYTGFPSYQHLTTFYQFLLPECNLLYYVGTENTSEGTSYEHLSKRGPNRSLSPMEELFITLVRLRKGLQERHLGDLYDISECHVSRIVNTWVLFLADRLQYLPIWPSQDHVKETMPAEFRDSFSSTRIIIDCTEIFIEQPSASHCQRETFSSYKHRNTAKGLIGIAPSGQITFISRLYAGRCSDKKIVRHCGLLDLLQEGDHVMADRGFDIEGDLKQRGAGLTMPPFLKGQLQFTEEALKMTRTVAAVRVHVERAVRKVKEFELIRNIVPISLCPMLEKIWFVTCHLANFTGSLIKQ